MKRVDPDPRNNLSMPYKNVHEIRFGLTFKLPTLRLMLRHILSFTGQFEIWCIYIWRGKMQMDPKKLRSMSYTNYMQLYPQ